MKLLIKVFFLKVALLLTISACGLLGFADVNMVPFPETMVTIEGEEINSIKLRPGESAILTYKNRREESTLTVHSEIRKKKTVRLGGYFYGGWEKDEKYLSERQLEWIGENVDILSLNLYNPNNAVNVIRPADIKELKDKNNQFRFYNMIFGTTMFEPIFDPETMSNWVLKYIDEREVLGLRRKGEDSKNHTMDLNNKEYATFFNSYITGHAQKYHADGVAIDEIMWKGYWGIKTESIIGYDSEDDYYRASLNFLKRISRNNPTEIIHQAFWDEAQQYSDGVWGELAFKYSYTGKENTVFYEKMKYSEIIKNMMEISSEKKTYIWAGWYRKHNRQDFKYVLATYLIGKGSNSLVFQPHPIHDGGYPQNLAGYSIKTFEVELKGKKKYINVELGDPIKPPEEVDGMWMREYENGKVFCYPR